MKQAYFTPENIGKKARDMLAKASSIRRRPVPLTLSPNTALLVLDMQEYFLVSDSHAFIPGAPAIFPLVQKLIDFFSYRELPVIYTQHINTNEDAGMMDEWWRNLIVESNPLNQITDQLTLVSKDVIRKSQYDAFYQTILKERLIEQNITDVVVTGVMTHLCCETTARSAFVNGFKVWFTVDGTATYNQDFHQATLTNLSHGFAIPVLVNEVVLGLRANDEG